MASRSPWRKILYKKQDYPDNYVDKDQFLNGLRKNLHTQTYGLQEVILVSGVVAQELSNVCMFVATYWFVQERWLSPYWLFLISLLLGASGLAISLSKRGGSEELLRTQDVFLDYIKPTVLVISFLCAVSPILGTLTESISTDTVWAMTVGMLLIHLLFYNYGSDGAMVSNAISLNAAVFAAVCLASRLSSSLHSFVIISHSVLMFTLFPKFRAHWNIHHNYALLLTTVAMIILTTIILSFLSSLCVLAYLLAVFSVTFIFPLLFVRLQHLKNNIYGPWDEATIQM